MTLSVLEKHGKKEGMKILTGQRYKEEISQIHGLNKERKLTNRFKWQSLLKNKAN